MDYSTWSLPQIRERREAFKAWALKRWHVTPPAQSEAEMAAGNGRKYSRGKIRAKAAQNGVEEIYDKVVSLSKEYGLGERPWARCLTLSPPRNGRYALVYIEPKPGHLSLGIWVGNFPQFFDITTEEIQAIIGSGQWFQVGDQNADDFLEMLDRLYLACGLTSH